MKYERFVYHGSPYLLTEGKPSFHRRVSRSGVLFSGITFHATPIKWIAAAYTYQPKVFTLDGRCAYYNVGINLKKHERVIDIYGINSLEFSLKELYGNGGYITMYDPKSFTHKHGLGALECIAYENCTPLKIEYIDNPIKLLTQEGILFRFIDLSIPRNRKFFRCVENN